MKAPALCQSHPEAATELGLLAIARACEANLARQAEARRQAEDDRLARAGDKFWWREQDSNDNLPYDQSADARPSAH